MQLESAVLKDIIIEDYFWSKHVNLVKDVILPYQWDAINDRIADAESSHSLENFKIAAGRSQGEFYGVVFQDTDVAKWLEAVGFTLAARPDAALEQTADEVIAVIAEAQCEDGYINTYFTLKEPEKRFRNLCEGHELYTAGHLMEAAYAYYLGTGKRKFLECMERFGNLICDTFGWEEGKIHGYPGHQEVEIGLMKLYRVSGNQKYLDTAKYFLDARGVGENYFIQEMKRPEFTYIFPEFHDYDTKYSQSHLPVRQQETAEGHAVRAVYMYCAMADVAAASKDAELLQACKQLWDNMTKKRMYITGGIGSSGILERFTTDYDLPNEYNYAETCASIGLALFGLRMTNLTGDAGYMDEVERALYNTVLAGIALDGRSFFYVNPLEVWPAACMERTSKEHVKSIRQKWFGVACCPPNIARTLASLGQYIYSTGGNQLFVNLFISNKSKITLENGEIEVEAVTRFPMENQVELKLGNIPEGGIQLALRIPKYADHYQVSVNGIPCTYKIKTGYALLDITKDSEVNLSFAAPPRFMRANPRVRADAGKVAVVRGPLVYCLEEIDNGENLSALFVDTKAGIIEVKSEQFGGTTELIFKGRRIKQEAWKESELYAETEPEYQEVTIKAIPYAYWNNRGEGEMCVWIKEL